MNYIWKNIGAGGRQRRLSKEKPKGGGRDSSETGKTGGHHVKGAVNVDKHRYD